jgi:hypothetical protein
LLTPIFLQPPKRWVAGLFAILMTSALLGTPQVRVAHASAQLLPANKARIVLVGLSFARKLPTTPDGAIAVLIVGDCETGTSLVDMDGKNLNGHPLRFKRIQASSRSQIEVAIAAEPPAALYFCGQSPSLAGSIRTLAQQKRFVTIADDFERHAGLMMLGVEVRNERPAIVLNAARLREIELEFDARIYSVARVIP